MVGEKVVAPIASVAALLRGFGTRSYSWCRLRNHKSNLSTATRFGAGASLLCKALVTTRHQMEFSPVRRLSRFASVTKLWRSRFYPTREESLTPVDDAAPNTCSDAAEHSHNSDSEEEMDEYDEYDAADREWSGERTEYFSPRIAAMIMKRRQGLDGVKLDIKFSRTHHSTVVAPTVEEAELDRENREVFRSLCNDPRWVCYGRSFFIPDFLPQLGAKIAEGGQAEIFEVGNSDQVVLKVFKKGYPLSQLQEQWPEAFLRDEVAHICYGGMMLKDGRFAFLMARAWGDLRKLIDLAMEKNCMQGPPFPFELHGKICSAKYVMFCIALLMGEMHKKGVFHQDLKASNILLFSDFKHPVLADFECSIGVEGTGFWRAPELLLALKNKVRPITFTEKMDVYGFAMTCYEIVTGHLPFEGQFRPIPSHYMESGGERPRLPSDLDVGVRDLIVRCWNWDPNVRPTFAEILAIETFDEFRR